MIGAFNLVSWPLDEHVAVVMSLEDNGNAMGAIRTSPDLRETIVASNLPAPIISLSFISALSYGVFIDGSFGRDMVVTGDLDAWPENWGDVRYVMQ